MKTYFHTHTYIYSVYYISDTQEPQIPLFFTCSRKLAQFLRPVGVNVLPPFISSACAWCISGTCHKEHLLWWSTSSVAGWSGTERLLKRPVKCNPLFVQLLPDAPEWIFLSHSNAFSAPAHHKHNRNPKSRFAKRTCKMTNHTVPLVHVFRDMHL